MVWSRRVQEVLRTWRDRGDQQATGTRRRGSIFIRRNSVFFARNANQLRRSSRSGPARRDKHQEARTDVESAGRTPHVLKRRAFSESATDSLPNQRGSPHPAPFAGSVTPLLSLYRREGRSSGKRIIGPAYACDSPHFGLRITVTVVRYGGIGGDPGTTRISAPQLVQAKP